MLVGVSALPAARPLLPTLLSALVRGLLLERLRRLRCLRLGRRWQHPVVATATVRGLLLRRRGMLLLGREGRGLLRLEGRGLLGLERRGRRLLPLER